MEREEGRCKGRREGAKGGGKVPSAKGQRMIVVQSGIRAGWMVLIGFFKSRSSNSDYHDKTLNITWNSLQNIYC